MQGPVQGLHREDRRTGNIRCGTALHWASSTGGQRGDMDLGGILLLTHSWVCVCVHKVCIYHSKGEQSVELVGPVSDTNTHTYIRISHWTLLCDQLSPEKSKHGLLTHTEKFPCTYLSCSAWVLQVIHTLSSRTHRLCHKNSICSMRQRVK